MRHPGGRSGRALAVLLAGAVLSAGCGARWAYRQGQGEAKKGNWDMAVARLTKAHQKDPDNIAYKIALENARVQASRQHYMQARRHMAADELDKAVEELEIAVKFDGANKSAADDLIIVRAKILKREEDKRRLTDFDAMKTRAQAQRLPIPVLSPRSTAPIHMNFADQSLQTIFEALGKVAGVNVLFDADYRDKKAKVQLQGVTFQEALDQITFAHRLFYKVIDKNTIIIVQDSQAKRRVYEDLLLRTFYLQNVDTKEVEAILKTALGPQAKVLGNPTVNALTVIGTVDQLALAERVIGANDKAKGEVMVEVQIMEVNRNKLKEYGIRLSNYGAGLSLAPIADPAAGASAPADLNIRAHLLSSLNLSDFIISIPSGIFTRFLQTEDAVKILASPRLRAAEGKKTALKIGTEVPIPVTTFTAAATPGTGQTFAPATSFQYRNVGVNLELTPKVTAAGEITLELGAEFSLPGNVSTVAGQELPTFFTRTVNGILRVRDGETTLVGGLLQQRETETFAGALGIQSIPILNRLIPSSSRRNEQMEILISITPHLVRAPKIVEEDLRPVLIGTQDLVRVEGARPPLFGEPEVAPSPAPSPAAPPGPATGRPPGTVSPGQPPAGEQPTPAVTPVPPQGLPTPLPAPGGEPTPDPNATPSPTPPPSGGGASGSAFSPPETSVRAGEMTTVSLVLMNAQNVTGVELMVAYDPGVLEAVDVGPGTLLTLDGSAVGSERNIEPGRMRARLTRPTPTSGSGVVAQLTFRALSPGASALNVEAIALTTAGGGTAAPALAAPARVTVTADGPPQ
jgi:general secretion pathway protein D